MNNILKFGDKNEKRESLSALSLLVCQRSVCHSYLYLYDSGSAGEILRLTENTLFNHIDDMAGDERINMRYVPLCDGLDRVVSEYLDRITLQDILDWNIGVFDYVI